MSQESRATHIHSKWLPGQVPGYRPTTDGAPNLPSGPKLPHVPHFRHAGRIAAFGLAGALALTAAEGFVKPTGTSMDPVVRAGEVPAELMLHGYGDQYLDLTLDSNGDLNIVLLGRPSVLNAGENHYVPVLTQSLNEDNPDDPFDHIKAVGLNEVMQGDVTLIKSDENGNPVLGSNGERIMEQPISVEGLSIPVAAELA